MGKIIACFNTYKAHTQTQTHLKRGNQHSWNMRIQVYADRLNEVWTKQNAKDSSKQNDTEFSTLR